jgi:CO/xanthine dehydrogenase Mo-binding subunit
VPSCANDLSEYRIPVNADIPPLECILVPEHDPHVHPLGIKGVGEIGITGSAGAIVNAFGMRRASASDASPSLEDACGLLS